MKNRQVELVRGLRNDKLKQAIDNYCNGVSLARIIPKECLNAEAINEFRKLHVLPFHTAKRNRCKIAETADVIVQKPVIEYPQLFEDEINISPAKTTISGVVQHNNGYGCAATMCAEG